MLYLRVCFVCSVLCAGNATYTGCTRGSLRPATYSLCLCEYSSLARAGSGSGGEAEGGAPQAGRVIFTVFGGERSLVLSGDS